MGSNFAIVIKIEKIARKNRVNTLGVVTHTSIGQLPFCTLVYVCFFCVCERERVCVFIVRVRESLCVCLCARERELVCVCVCVCFVCLCE